MLHLHALWAQLEALLIREGRLELAEACFAFLPARARLDLLGYGVLLILRTGSQSCRIVLEIGLFLYYN